MITILTDSNYRRDLGVLSISYDSSFLLVYKLLPPRPLLLSPPRYLLRHHLELFGRTLLLLLPLFRHMQMRVYTRFTARIPYARDN